MKGRLLIVEDDEALNQVLVLHFEDRGYEVIGALNVRETLELVAKSAPDVALIDQNLPDGSGLELLGQLLGREPDLPIIMVTGTHDLDLAIRAIQIGGFDFVNKPIQIEELNHVVGRAFEHRRLSRKATALTTEVESPTALGEMIGQSRAMVEVSKEIALVAASKARVLITGESGTGKELVARAIHAHSGCDGPFLAVNCAAIVDNLLESELFGHEKGAFTGAVARRTGKFELATDGTLFLDEVGELALPLQAKLLRVLQEGVFERVGGTQQLHTEARVVTATNRDLYAEVQAGQFREDLLYRLSVTRIQMPALKDRQGDIPLLVEGLLERLAKSLHRKPLQVTEAAMRRLVAYHWPGNVRELENVLTQALIRTRGGVLLPELIDLRSEAFASTAKPWEEGSGERPMGPPPSLDEVEAQHIQNVLEYAHGHKGQTCEILGISRPALDRKIRKYGLDVPR